MPIAASTDRTSRCRWYLSWPCTSGTCCGRWSSVSRAGSERCDRTSVDSADIVRRGMLCGDPGAELGSTIIVAVRASGETSCREDTPRLKAKKESCDDLGGGAHARPDYRRIRFVGFRDRPQEGALRAGTRSLRQPPCFSWLSFRASLRHCAAVFRSSLSAGIGCLRCMADEQRERDPVKSGEERRG